MNATVPEIFWFRLLLSNHMQKHFESLDILENLQIYEILRLGHQNGINDKDHI
jgi:hypothetical protein